MTKIKTFLVGVAKRAITYGKEMVRKEPTRVVGVAVTVILTAASVVGVVVDKGTATMIVTLILSLVVPPSGAELLRRRVSPA